MKNITTKTILSAIAGITLLTTPAMAEVDRFNKDRMPAKVDADTKTEITIAQGALIGGVHESGAYVWRGIPFAQAPIGELRWRAPRPAPSWEETRDATAYHNRCIQYADAQDGRSDSNLTIGNEDCLYLNVATPPKAHKNTRKKRPVMFWIHGGGNLDGHSGMQVGANLAAKHDVVVVTTNYRMGQLGFFSHPALRETAITHDDKSANFGILDQVAALKWVQDNIATFGGDPNNVTVFGNSAGSTDTAVLLVAPQAEGLFHKAALHSGTAASVTPDQAENGGAIAFGAPVPSTKQRVRDFLDQGGIDTPVEKFSAQELVETLQGLSTHEIAAGVLRNPAGNTLVSPVGDGIVIRTPHIMQSFRDPELFHNIPVISGFTRDETKLFAYFLGADQMEFFEGGQRPKNDRLYDLTAEYGSQLWGAYMCQ